MMKLPRVGRAVMAGAVLMALGCGDSQSPAGNTQFSVLLKDAPGDVVTAVVTIEEVQLVGEGGVEVLTSTPATVDLLTLANETLDLVDEAVVPSGTYTELRFVISGGYIEVENDGGGTSLYASSPTYAGLPPGATVDGDLQMPSFAQSGLKVTLPSSALTLTGEQKIVVVDFDVSQSFGQQAGGSGMWVMHPVITGVEIEATGSVQVLVELDGITLPAPLSLADLSVTLTNTTTLSETTVALTDENTDNVFDATFIYVAPGNYEVALVLPPELASITTTPTLPAAVTVTSDQQATVTLSVTDATEI